uniref:NADH-ubiquinone oxidoreductase chain 6 n=1 Tax=Lissodema cursor TaxID=1586495 RepID=A0A343C359_9CUCU|nr:NADH dehydrogenase subunit 6 [Lissodema cursor]
MNLFIMNLFLSILFLMIYHPLSMGLILLLQTLIISLITSNFFMNFWFSYILFLIMIGGMLILFIYMTSIASNEKFHISMNTYFFMQFFIILLLTLNPKFFLPLFNMNMLNNELLMLNKNMMMNISMNKFFFYPFSLILLFIIIYLFFALIIITKITNLNMGPLRQMN